MSTRRKAKAEVGDSSWPTLETFSALAPQPTRVGQINRSSLRRSLETNEYSLVQGTSNLILQDVSMNGIAIKLNDPAELLDFAVGTEITGVLNLRGKPFAFVAKVRHQRVGVVGCQFRGPSQALLNEIARLLDPSGVAKEMRKASPIQGTTHTFLGPSGSGVLIWEGGGEITQFAIYLLGIFARWAKGQVPETGISCQKSETEWAVLSKDEPWSDTKLETVRRFLDHAEAIPRKLADACRKNIK